jgi:hypothetical protein
MQKNFERRKERSRSGNRQRRNSRYSLDWLYWGGLVVIAGVLLWIFALIILEAIYQGFK